MATSTFFDECLSQLHSTAAAGPVIDLACGRGRHALACAEHGLQTVGIDRNASHLHALSEAGNRTAVAARMSCVQADLETAGGIPLKPGSCGAILVFRFLFRPLAGAVMDTLAPGGLLAYETFTVRQRELGFGPSRDAFLLEAGELRALFSGLEILEYAEGLTDEARPSHTARLLARKR